MTWKKETSLWCDDENCSEWIRFVGRVGDAEKWAGEEGWSNPSPDEHYCPKHND